MVEEEKKGNEKRKNQIKEKYSKKYQEKK